MCEVETTTNISIERVQKSRLTGINFDEVGFGKVFTDHMFHAEFSNGSWNDLMVMPYQTIPFYPALMALHYGQSIFEGMKAYRTDNNEVVLFRPQANLERFNISAERMCMPSVPEDVFMEGILRLLEIDKGWVPEQKGYSLYIRPFMFASDQFLGVRPSNEYKFFHICSPAGAYYNKALRVKVETEYVRSAEGGIGFTKAAANYGLSMYPTQKAQAEGFDQVIWTDACSHQYVEEAGTANLVFVIKGELVTPPVKNTILKGITRDSIVTLARDMGITVHEREISISEIVDAVKSGSMDEAFACGTAATITPISEIGYKGDVLTLPAVENREVSARIFNALSDIRHGRSEDKFNWLVKVK